MKSELLISQGESSADRLAFQKYLSDVARGKGLLQLKYTSQAMTPWIRESWSPGTFTHLKSPIGDFDAVTCSISYHFNKHGNKFGTIYEMTRAALDYLRANRTQAQLTSAGCLKLPHGLFDLSGRIIWFD
jgi:hypothetical protein